MMFGWFCRKKVAPAVEKRFYSIEAAENVTPVIVQALIENPKLAERVRVLVPKSGDRAAALQVYFLTLRNRELVESMLAEALRSVNWKEVEKVLDNEINWDKLRRK